MWLVDETLVLLWLIERTNVIGWWNTGPALIDRKVDCDWLKHWSCSDCQKGRMWLVETLFHQLILFIVKYKSGGLKTRIMIHESFWSLSVSKSVGWSNCYKIRALTTEIYVESVSYYEVFLSMVCTNMLVSGWLTCVKLGTKKLN